MAYYVGCKSSHNRPEKYKYTRWQKSQVNDTLTAITVFSLSLVVIVLVSLDMQCECSHDSPSFLFRQILCMLLVKSSNK